LVRVAVCGGLEVPFATVPKSIAAGVKVTVLDEETVKPVELVPVPLGVVTLIGPVVAPLGTEVEIWVSELTVKVDEVPLKVTDVAPVNPDPEMVTAVPAGPLVGEKDEMLGGVAVVTVKLAELVPVPLGVVTLIGPVVAPAGTEVLIWVSEFTVKVAAVPLKFTEVAPVNPEPETVTVVPVGPLVGENELIVGAEGVLTVKLVELVPVPFGAVTLIGPVVALLGTEVEI
jgi:hypothetical protein